MIASTGPVSHCQAFGGNNTAGPIDVATACNAHGGASGRMDFESETFVAFSCKDHGADAGDVSPTLRAMGHGESHPNAGGQVAVAFNWQGGGEQTTLGYDPASGTTGSLHVGQTPAVAFDMRGRDGGAMPEGPHDTANIRAANGGSSRSYIAAPTMVRRLTPVECERLQGFPDGFTDIPWGKRAPDGRRYKALGNSMAVPCVGWILDRIRAFDAAE